MIEWCAFFKTIFFKLPRKNECIVFLLSDTSIAGENNT